ncbi:MAG: hypothetical protein AAF493_25065, partial [Pseudomonadota bacterium]
TKIVRHNALENIALLETGVHLEMGARTVAHSFRPARPPLLVRIVEQAYFLFTFHWKLLVTKNPISA